MTTQAHPETRTDQKHAENTRRTEPHAKCFGQNIESDLALEFLRVVENAAIESARTMGQGDRHLSDQVATETMRKTMDTVPMHGTIVIGEGERDEAPMLYIGEQVGGTFSDGQEVPHVDIAVDPLEGTNLCATGSPGAITVLAASEKGGLLHAPDCYMEKIVVGPSCKNAVELDAPVSVNLKNIARRLHRGVEDLVVMVLDRPRHEKLISDIRKAGARIKLIGDGDLFRRNRCGDHWNWRARGHGFRRRARGRDHRSRDPLPEWIYARPTRDRQARTGRAHREDGNQRRQDESTKRKTSRPENN